MAYFRCVGGNDSVNILKGKSDPTSPEGNDGQIYLKWVDYENDYTIKEYLEASGNQSIDTNVNIDPTSYFELKGAFTTNQTNNNIYGLGFSYKESNVLVASNKIYNQIGGSPNVNITYDTNEHIFKADASALYIDSTQTANPNWNNVPAGQRIRLFATAYGGIFDSSRISYAKIYYCKMYKEDNLIRHFIPAERNSDNVLGMLDIVNGVFYTNSGSGSFTAGPTTTPISGSPVIETYAKVNGVWQNLIGTNINDIN